MNTALTPNPLTAAVTTWPMLATGDSGWVVGRPTRSERARDDAQPSVILDSSTPSIRSACGDLS